MTYTVSSGTLSRPKPLLSLTTTKATIYDSLLTVGLRGVTFCHGLRRPDVIYSAHTAPKTFLFDYSAVGD